MFPAIIRLACDDRPVRWTGSRLSRRTLAAGAAALAIAGLIRVANWWWQPHVRWAASTGVRRIQFETEWHTDDSPDRLIWSSDDAQLLAFSASNGWLTRLDAATGATQKSSLGQSSFCGLPDFVANQSILVISRECDRLHRTAFAVIDIKTSRILYRRATAADAINPTFAPSPDGSRLAVSFWTAPPSDLVSLYDTADWHRVPFPDVSAYGGYGVGPAVFSPDGTTLAVGVATGVIVIDLRSGKILHTLLSRPGTGIDFSPDSSMFAYVNAEEIFAKPVTKDTLHVVRFRDEAEMASRDVPSMPARGTLWPAQRTLWDPKGRFLVLQGEARGTLLLWNPFAETAADVELDLRPYIESFAISRDGSVLAVGSTNPFGKGSTIRIFRIE